MCVGLVRCYYGAHLAAEHVAEGKAVEDLREELEHALVVLVLHL